MRNLLVAIVSYIRSQVFDFVGCYGDPCLSFATLTEAEFDSLTELGFDSLSETCSSSTCGPYLNLVPEEVSMPYMVYSVSTNDTVQGFSGLIGDKPIISFKLYDTNLQRLSTNVETFQSNLSSLRSLTVSNERCAAPLRRANAKISRAPIYQDGQRAYVAEVIYEFRNSYTKGNA